MVDVGTAYSETTIVQYRRIGTVTVAIEQMWLHRQVALDMMSTYHALDATVKKNIGHLLHYRNIVLKTRPVRRHKKTRNRRAKTGHA